METVSILIPYFNRKKFEKLIEYNIKCQTYPFIKEIIIADDSTEPGQTLQLDIPFELRYLKCKRMTIGAKRNYLKKHAEGDILVHMDTDDVYNPCYVQNIVNTITSNNCPVTGSSDMLFINMTTNWTGRQSCMYINMLNEATMGYTKEYANNHHYQDRSHSENESFTTEYWKIYETPIQDIMICVCHGGNTVDKNVWQTDQFKSKLPAWFWKTEHYRILKTIFPK
jgi:glycosyltransferase involved in cell wall biosynthesis